MKSKPLVQIYKRKTATGITIYLHYTINGKQIRESTGLRLTGNKQTDQETERAAKLLQANKTNELLTDRTGLATKNLKSKMLFTDYCKRIVEEKNREKQNKGGILTLLSHIQTYKPAVKLAEIDKEFCTGFISHLQTTISKKGSKRLMPATIKVLFAGFKAILSRAEKEDLIPINYAKKVEQPTAKQTERVFLTETELKAFAAIQTEKTEKEIQAAFLFSCLVGLRVSDIKRLTTDNISDTGAGLKLNIQTQKTGKQISFNLSGTAAAIISERITESGGRLFDLPTLSIIEKDVKKIAERAGINKRVTFHTARHTFATLLLTKGADVYTISELLGHSNIKTTQIYAKIVDAKKDKATSLLNGII